MARIFISHSNRNNAEALALRDWLISEGWHELFLDIDPQRGIVAGQRWLDALAAAGQRAKAVIFIVTRDWLDSDYCRIEFFSAKEKGKALFGVLVDDTPISAAPPEMTTVWQFANLSSGSAFRTFLVAPPPDYGGRQVSFSKEGLESLRQGLIREGLGSLATESFPWPAPGFEVETDEGRAGQPRSPFRGLKALEAPDAGVFFGRDADLTRAIDQLQQLRDDGGGKLVAILGASGSGKSSFLRAGLLPRLERLSDRFLPLPPIRPLRHAVTGRTGFLTSLSAAFRNSAPPVTRAELHTDLADMTRLALRLGQLQSAAASRRVGQSSRYERPPTLVLAIDQLEELFAPRAVETEAFLDLLVGLLRHGPETIALASIRTDAAGSLQEEERLRNLKESFLLDPLARDGRRAAIEGPTRRLVDANRQLLITPTLIDRLLDDAEGGDGLPLMAFVLERLWEDHDGHGRLGETEYDKLGGVRGAIAAAWEAAFADPEDSPVIPVDAATRDSILRRTVLRGMVGLEESSDVALRRPVLWSQIDAEAYPLLERLITARLLRTDVDSDGRRTVEFAHEALLRQPPVSSWIGQDREFLAWRGTTARARVACASHKRGLLSGLELEIARGWLEARERGDIPEDLRDFIADSAAAEERHRTSDMERERQRQQAELDAALAREDAAKVRAAAARRVAQRTMAGMLAALILAIGAGLAGWYAWQQQRVAVAETGKARTAEAKATAAQKQATADRDAAQLVTRALIDSYRSATEFVGQHRDVAGVQREAARRMLLAAKERLEKLEASILDEAELQGYRALVLIELGYASFGVGHHEQALVAFEQAHTIADRLSNSDSHKKEWLEYIALARRGKGNVFKIRGRLDDALREYRTSLEVFERLRAKDTTNTRWKMQSARSHEDIGDVLIKQRNFVDALNRYRVSYGVFTDLVGSDPGNDKLRREWSWPLEEIADATKELGDLDEALRKYGEVLDIRKDLSRRDRTSLGCECILAAAHRKMGDALRLKKDFANAKLHFAESIDILKRLVQLDPTNAIWQYDLALALGGMAAILDEGDSKLTEARQLLHDARSRVAKLYEISQDHVYWKRELDKFDDSIAGLSSRLEVQ